MERSLHIVHEKAPTLPPPVMSVGIARWLKDNLFSSASNIVLTFVVIYLLRLIIPPFLDWAIFDAVWNAASRAECWGIPLTAPAGRWW